MSYEASPKFLREHEKSVLKKAGACVAAPVHFTFDRHLGSLGSQYLRDRALLNAAIPRDVQLLIRNVGSLYYLLLLATSTYRPNLLSIRTHISYYYVCMYVE